MPTDHSYGVIPYRMHNGRREFLLIQHKSGGHWAFPKGHAELGETPLQAAKRELAEETGLTFVALQSAPAFEECYPTRWRGQAVDKTVTYYLGDVLINQTVKVQVAEVRDYAWLNAKDALARITYADCREMFEQVLFFWSAASRCRF